MESKYGAVLSLFESENIVIIKVLVEMDYIDRELFMKAVCEIFSSTERDFGGFSYDIINLIDNTWGFDVEQDKEVISKLLTEILGKLVPPQETDLWATHFKRLVDLGGETDDVSTLAHIPFECLSHYVSNRNFELTADFLDHAMIGASRETAQWAMQMWEESNIRIFNSVSSLLSNAYFHNQSLFPRVLQRLQNCETINVAIYEFVSMHFFCADDRINRFFLDNVLQHTSELQIHNALVIFSSALVCDDQGKLDSSADKRIKEIINDMSNLGKKLARSQTLVRAKYCDFAKNILEFSATL